MKKCLLVTTIVFFGTQFAVHGMIERARKQLQEDIQKAAQVVEQEAEVIYEDLTGTGRSGQKQLSETVQKSSAQVKEAGKQISQ